MYRNIKKNEDKILKIHKMILNWLSGDVKLTIWNVN